MWLVDLPFTWSCYPKQISEFCNEEITFLLADGDFGNQEYTCATADIEAYLVGGGVNDEFHARTVELMCLTKC